MADLEKTIDPVMDNTEDTNPAVDQGKDFEINLGSSTTEEQETTDFSNLFSEDVTKDDTANSNTENASNEVSQEEQEEKVETLEKSELQPEMSNSEPSINEKLLEEAQPIEGSSNQETDGNNILLGKFESEMINTVDTPKEENIKENSAILDHPAILENYQSVEESSPILNAEKQEKERLIQKEKLAQLVKTHEIKAEKNGEKSGFTKGILSGIVLTAGIVVATFIFAKDQVISLINGGVNNVSLSANIVDVANNTNNDETINNEEVINEEVINDEEIINDKEITNNEEIINDEQIIDVIEIIDDENTIDYEEVVNNEVADDSEIIDEEKDESIAYEEATIDEIAIANGESTSDKEEITINEEQISEEVNNKPTHTITITRVSSESEANWVRATHCSDLTCYGDKEFVACNRFKQKEDLDENAQRVFESGACKYKDPSELVYVEFNN